MRDYSDFQLTKAERCRTITLLAVFILLVGLLFYSSLLPLLLVPFLLKPAEKLAAEFLCRRQKKILRRQFQDFLRCLASSMETGRHMREALGEVEKELLNVYDEGQPIILAVREMRTQMDLAGMTDLEALRWFAARADLEDAQDLVQVFQGSRTAGGDFCSSVRKCASVLQDKIKIEQDIELMIAQKQYEGKIITVMPALVILFLRLVSPEYIAVLYTSLAGRITMTVCLLMAAAAYRLIDRITDIAV